MKAPRKENKKGKKNTYIYIIYIYFLQYRATNKMAIACIIIYCMRFNFRGVYISRILSFSDFCVLIFADGHVLPLHKSLI